MRVVSVLCVAAIAFACDAARAQPNRIDSVRTSPSAAAAVSEFWTPERLREASPLPVPVAPDPGPRSPAFPSDPQRSGQPKGAPNSLARASGVSGSVATRPLYWAGKFFFTKSDGPKVCSAQFISPGIVITAAHCIRDDNTGQWYSNLLYRHQYDRGKSARDFGAECFTTYNGWVSPENSKWEWDYAILKLRGGADQGHFGWQAGWWGTYNSAPKIGYPGAIEQGQIMQVDFGRLIKGRTPRLIGLAHGNPRNAEGSSGGAWVGKYETSGNDPRGNYVISVTSHHMGEDRGTTYGPYWGDDMEKLLNHAKRGCR
jgi:Trypsin